MSPQLHSMATSTLAASTQSAGSGELTASSGVIYPRRRTASRTGRGKTLAEGSQVIMEGELEKRGDSMLQLWKKKVCVLTKEGLSVFPDSQKRSRCKEFPFHSIKKLDCVERSGKYIYFTIVTTDNKEIDFRCSDESTWNATITMALIDYQNKKAIQHFRERQGSQRVRRTSSTERPTARCV